MSLNNSASSQPPSSGGNSSDPRPGGSPFPRPSSNSLVRRGPSPPSPPFTSNPTSSSSAAAADPYSSQYTNNFNRAASRYSTGRLGPEPSHPVDESVYSDNEPEEEIPDMRPPPLRTRPQPPPRSQTDPPAQPRFQQTFRTQRQSGYDRRRHSPPIGSRGYSSARVFVNIGEATAREGDRWERSYAWRTGGARDGGARVYVNVDPMAGGNVPLGGGTMGMGSLFGDEGRAGLGLFGWRGGVLRGPVNLPFGL